MKKGFTLSEVLITLGVIGVVAAMTLPSVISKHQEKQTVVKLKKAYSTLSQAYALAVEEDGSPESWEILGRNNFEGATNIYNKLSKHLKIIKDCGSGAGCFADGKYHYKDGSNWIEFTTPTSSSLNDYRFVMADGFSVYIQTREADCSESFGDTEALKNVGCAFLGVDINGKQRPNTLGKDLFILIMTKNGIIPRGGANFTTSTFGGNCLNSKVAWSCAAWVIYNENMDYLHCNDLSWDGKTKCK